MKQLNISKITKDEAIKIRGVWGMCGKDFANTLNDTIREFSRPTSRLTNLDKTQISRYENGEKIPENIARAYHILERTALVGGMQKVKSKYLPNHRSIEYFWHDVLHKEDERAEYQALLALRALRGGQAEYPDSDPDVWPRLALDLGIFYWVIQGDMNEAKKWVVSALKSRPKSTKLKALIAYSLIGFRCDSIESSLSDEEKKKKGVRLLEKLKINCINADFIAESQYLMGAARISSKLLNDEEEFRKWFAPAVKSLGLDKKRVYALLKRRPDSKDFENACHFRWVELNFLNKQS